jgi:hypothetical protein
MKTETTRSALPIRLYWTAFGYTSHRTFETVEAAIAHAQTKCFSAAVYFGDDLMATWNPLHGLTRF